MWLIITPFDRPVVPPVYSSAASPSGSASASAPSGAVSSTAKSSSGGPPPLPLVSAPDTMIARTSVPAAAAWTLARNSGVVTANAAPLSVSTCRSSASLSRNSTGVATAPARHTAW